MDWGGTPPKVKVADLVATAQRREELEMLQNALDAKLKLAGNLEEAQKLVQLTESMSPSKKKKLQELIVSPDEDDDDDDLDAAVQSVKGGDPDKRRLDDVEKAIGVLATLERQRHEDRPGS